METKEKIEKLLVENGYKCNADGRKFIADRVGALTPRQLDPEKWLPILKYVEENFGFTNDDCLFYATKGGKSAVTGHDLYALPEVYNPVLVVFSGMMTAHLCAFEAIRFYAKKYYKLLPILAIGKGGNKGLYEEVFNRPQGLMVEAEYQAYLNLLDQLAPRNYVHANEQVCADTDTAGNFDELYKFAKAAEKPVTFVLCSGNFSYYKRLLAEFMLKAEEPQYSDVKMDFAIAHCPIITKLHVVDGRLSEIMLGYIAASIGPMMKDTITFDGKTSSEHPERYLMPGMDKVDWAMLQELIAEYSNMGWPNYSELLYGTDHKKAVLDIILADLRARGSFSSTSYDEELLKDLNDYIKFLGGRYWGQDEQEFLAYLCNTPDEHYF